MDDSGRGSRAKTSSWSSARKGDEFGHSYRNADADAWLVDIPKGLVAVDAPAEWHGGHLCPYTEPALPLGSRLSNDDFHVTAKCRQQAHESLDGILPKIPPQEARDVRLGQSK